MLVMLDLLVDVETNSLFDVEIGFLEVLVMLDLLVDVETNSLFDLEIGFDIKFETKVSEFSSHGGDGQLSMINFAH